MAAVRPSTAIVVYVNTPIGDCIRKMRDHGVGSVLVVDYSEPCGLLGIFTERDLVKRIDEIQHGNHWEKAIATVMQAPVVTVSLYELHRASEIMLKHNFRHLPVVYTDKDAQIRVAGVISMRDLFRKAIQEQTEKHSEEASSGKEMGTSLRRELFIGIISKTDDSGELLKWVFSQGGKANLKNFPMAQWAEAKGRKPYVDILVLDIDRHDPNLWAKCLRTLNSAEQPRFVIVVFNPALHEKKNIQIIRKLAENGRFAAFAKPINVLEILNQVRVWLR